MKRNWKLLLPVTLLCAAIAYGGAIIPTTEITLGPIQSVYQDGNTAVPDSMRVSVFRNGAQSSNGWFNSTDPQCAIWSTNWLLFTDVFQDIDGAGGNGHYSVMVMAYDADSTLYTPYYWSFEVGIMFDPANDAVTSTDTNASGLELVTVEDSTAFQGAANSFTLADVKYWISVYLTMCPGCKAYYDQGSSYDDIHVVDSIGDTVVTQRWHHVAGAAGDVPDTVKGIAP